MYNWKETLYFRGHTQVCSAIELADFGERSPSSVLNEFLGSETNHPESLEEFKEVLREITKRHDEYYSQHNGSWQDKSIYRVGCIFAFTSSLQPRAEENLAALGFTGSGRIPKLKHPDSDLQIWWIKPSDFLEAIEYS